MVDDAIRSETPSAAPPATENRDADLLSGLAELGYAAAQGFQGAIGKAIQADELDKACAAETHFSSLALGIRRAIALKARLCERREEAQRQAEDRKDRRQRETNERRHQVAQGVAQAIAAAKPADADARERLTADLWTRLSEDDRIDADLADTVLPIATLVRRMCRDLGISDEPALAVALAPAAAIKAEAEDPAEETELCTASGFRYRAGRFRRVPSAELGRPDTEHYLLDTETREIFPPPPPPIDLARPPDPGGAGPPPMTGPPPTESELIDAEIRRREAEAWDRLRLAVHMHISALG